METPGPRVKTPTVSALGLELLPRIEKVPPFSVTPTESPTRLLTSVVELFKRSRPPAFTTTDVLPRIVPLPARLSVPPLTVVGPVYVVLEARTTRPLPAAAIPPPPPMTPENVVTPEPASVSVLPPLATLPEMVKELDELFVQVCGVPSAREALMVTGPAPGFTVMPLVPPVPVSVRVLVAGVPAAMPTTPLLLKVRLLTAKLPSRVVAA